MCLCFSLRSRANSFSLSVTFRSTRAPRLPAQRYCMAEVRGPVFLISGGQTMRKRKGPDPLLQTVIRWTGVRRPMIAYLGTASRDDDAFRLWFTRLLQKAGAGE